MEQRKASIDANQMDDEKTRSQLGKLLQPGITQDEVKINDAQVSEKEQIPEIIDIYDYIYGNVQNKLEFYERKASIGRKISADSASIKSYSSDAGSHKTAITPTEILLSPHSYDIHEIYKNHTLHEESINTKPLSEDEYSINDECASCQKNSFIKDRNDILTEINSQLKLELEDVKEDLKQEILRTNDLNFQIANIETILETYHNDFKNNQSHFSTLYSTMKDYVVDQKANYTYKRIKSIANYIDRLKTKLDQQDNIIKNNFMGNPYSTDLMVKHAALRKQLDEMSKENEYLKEELKCKTSESMDIIKELTRQKFDAENKYSELEKSHKEESTAKDDIAKQIKVKHEQHVQQLQSLLKRKEKELVEMEKDYEAQLTNSKTEINILYRKLNNQIET